MSRALREKMLREGGVETGELHYGTVDDVVKAAGRFVVDEGLDGEFIYFVFWAELICWCCRAGVRRCA